MEDDFEKRLADIRARINRLRGQFETEGSREEELPPTRPSVTQEDVSLEGRKQDLGSARKEKELDDIRKKLMQPKNTG